MLMIDVFNSLADGSLMTKWIKFKFAKLRKFKQQVKHLKAIELPDQQAFAQN